MDLSEIFRFVNFAVGAFMVAGGIGQFFPHFGIQNVIVGIYVILFGCSTILLEIQIPAQVSRYASFMFSFLGRGLFYIFIGCVIFGDNWWKYLAGGLITLVGIGYSVLEYIPSIEPPMNMRDADASWGSEQV
ncbi:COPI associated [Trichodelitschia bisporula]|uniref:COPI associated n=1 Tax=Trichodelitschia bisporula TaxID=703511 RepID=A0A6G1HKL1_9PEZI|nr:COPI associated [Trichodelitschia bisporula]